MDVIYKVLDLKRQEVTLVKYLSSRYELIEEVEVPEGEDIDEFLQCQKEEVFLGDMCESRTRY